MSSFRPALCAGLVTGLLLLAPAAEARFGKKTADTSDSKGDAKVHEATPIQPRSTHAASSPSDDDDDDDADDDCCDTPGPSYTARLYGDAPVVSSSSLSTSEEQELADMAVRNLAPRPPAPPIDVRMGLNVGAMGGGSSGDVFLGIEGTELGVDFQGTKLTLPTDDGTPGTDVIHLVGMHVTWAAVSTERLRLRAEAGFTMASAPDVFLAGPSLATSLEACVVGPLDVEVRVQGTPAPYRQLDAQAGVAVHLGALMLRAGWRGLILDDAGQVDGVAHVDRFTGPYGGAGFVF
ncbi:hypothetical protein [Corallococcus llansteffanensis]|uniref:TIGR04219 family outer membrane beta-barrel protein n=1 Tax=Corallococcus llansteffanensis TaxID=2316731 RepID=A0A3A8P6L3_9BACT|nr:hypothetical protein [Corallococcus llansteffanensis]RKH49045.1 hypothetical protein D7V93_32435 [Corallococcus llansteffanensis]